MRVETRARMKLEIFHYLPKELKFTINASARSVNSPKHGKQLLKAFETENPSNGTDKRSTLQRTCQQLGDIMEKEARTNKEANQANE